jgi:hypothetical protein
MLAIVSEVRWLFVGFVGFMGFRGRVFEEMQGVIKRNTGRELDELDVTIPIASLRDIPTLLVHDPNDEVTSFRNARRNHSHWTGSWLYTPVGAGHHLGSAEVTGHIVDFLIHGARPAGAELNDGRLSPLPPEMELRDLEVDGVTNFYG